MNWARAFIVGAGSASLMMAFIDIFNMMGVTPFSFEKYLGTLITENQYAVHSFTIGVLVNWILGGIFGLFYAYFFEYVFKAANARLGTIVGFSHAILAAIAFFPFFGIIHEFLNTGLYRDFGFFGSSLGGPTPILLLFSHLIFGTMMGTFYGPVQRDRVRARHTEPGYLIFPGVQDPQAISSADDHEDRAAI